MPDRAEPSRAGLTISARVADAGANASSSAQDALAVTPPSVGAPDLEPVDDRHAEAARQALEDRLVHADRRGSDAGAGVGEAGRLEQRLDRAVLAERAVERDERRPARVARRPSRSSAAPAADADRPRRARPGRRTVAPATGPRMVGRAAATSGRRGRSASRSTGWPRRRSASRDGRARHERHVVLRRRAAQEHDDRRAVGASCRRELTRRLLAPARPARPIAREDDLEARARCPSRVATVARTCSPSRRTSAAVPALVVDDEVGVLLGLTVAPPMRVPLRPGVVDEPAGRSPGGLRNTLPADGRPSGWCACRQRRISSSRSPIVSGVGGLEPERGPRARPRRPGSRCLSRLSR